MAVALQGDSVALWDQYQKTRDLGVRNSLVLRNMGLVYRLAGKYAPLVPEQSVRGMIRVINGLTMQDSGRFLDWQGNEIPW